MEGRQLCQEIRNTVCLEEEVMFIRALLGHSGKKLDVSAFSQKQNVKSYAPFLYHLGFSRHEDSKNRRTCAKKVWEGTETGNQCTSHSCSNWIETPTRSTNRPFT